MHACMQYVAVHVHVVCRLANYSRGIVPIDPVHSRAGKKSYVLESVLVLLI
jgi:hypothetical protein